MKRWFGSAHRIDKRLRHFPWRIDCCFKNQESARDQKELLQRQHQVLAVVNQTERQRDIELAQFAWVDIVNRHALVSDIKSQNFLNKISLANEFTWRVDSDPPFRTTPFHFVSPVPRDSESPCASSRPALPRRSWDESVRYRRRS